MENYQNMHLYNGNEGFLNSSKKIKSDLNNKREAYLPDDNNVTCTNNASIDMDINSVRSQYDDNDEGLSDSLSNNGLRWKLESKLRTYNCKFCSKVFKHRSGVSRHLKHSHSQHIPRRVHVEEEEQEQEEAFRSDKSIISCEDVGVQKQEEHLEDYSFTFNTYLYDGHQIYYKNVNDLVDVLGIFRDELKQIRFIERELIKLNIIADENVLL